MLNEMWNRIRKQTAVLYIDDTSLRLLVIKGQRVKKWADLKLEHGIVNGSMVVLEDILATKIKQLFESQQVKTKKVILGYSGLHSLTRPIILPELPSSMIGEAVVREARRILPVPIDQLYLTWRTVFSSKGKTQAFIATTPRKSADSLVKAVQKAGLIPRVMTIKPLALTNILPVNTAIIVDMQPTEFDIVITANGIPQPIRTVSLPSEDLSWEKKLETIASDLDRTIKFYDTNNPEKPLDTGVPIYISGELLSKPEIAPYLADRTGHPTQPITAPDLKTPEQIDLARYMVNIALATTVPSSLRGSLLPVSNLNQLPAPYQPKPMSLSRVIGIPGGVAVAALVVPMLILMQNNSNYIESVQSQISTTNQIINQKNAQGLEIKNSITLLEEQLATMKTKNENLDISLNGLTTHHEHINGDLEITLGNLSSSITLTNISVADGTLVLSGTAPDENDIYAYAQTILSYGRQLDLSERYTETTVSSIKGKDGTLIEFTLTFKRGG